jgi:hypothetical protein
MMQASCASACSSHAEGEDSGVCKLLSCRARWSAPVLRKGEETN